MMTGNPFIPEVPAKPSDDIYRLMINVVYIYYVQQLQ